MRCIVLHVAAMSPAWSSLILAIWCYTVSHCLIHLLQVATLVWTPAPPSHCHDTEAGGELTQQIVSSDSTPSPIIIIIKGAKVDKICNRKTTGTHNNNYYLINPLAAPALIPQNISAMQRYIVGLYERNFLSSENFRLHVQYSLLLGI